MSQSRATAGACATRKGKLGVERPAANLHGSPFGFALGSPFGTATLDRHYGPRPRTDLQRTVLRLPVGHGGSTGHQGRTARRRTHARKRRHRRELSLHDAERQQGNRDAEPQVRHGPGGSARSRPSRRRPARELRAGHPRGPRYRCAGTDSDQPAPDLRGGHRVRRDGSAPRLPGHGHHHPGHDRCHVHHGPRRRAAAKGRARHVRHPGRCSPLRRHHDSARAPRADGSGRRPRRCHAGRGIPVPDLRSRRVVRLRRPVEANGQPPPRRRRGTLQRLRRQRRPRRHHLRSGTALAGIARRHGQTGTGGRSPLRGQGNASPEHGGDRRRGRRVDIDLAKGRGIPSLPAARSAVRAGTVPRGRPERSAPARARRACQGRP